MSSNAEDTRVSPAYRLIHHYREQAMAAVDRLDQSFVNGTVSLEVRRDLATAALNYYYALYEHRDEEALNEPWDKRGITWVSEYAGETVEVDHRLPRKNGATTKQQRPKLLAVDPTDLRDAILELNDIAKELGLSARIEQSTPRTEIPDEMFDEVREWQKRNQQ